MTTTVRDNPESLRYEAVHDGELCGVIDYEIVGDAIDLQHTVVDRDRRESGVGGALVQGALDHIRTDSSYRVIATCSFVRAFIDEHPEYADLLER